MIRYASIIPITATAWEGSCAACNIGFQPQKKVESSKTRNLWSLEAQAEEKKGPYRRYSVGRASTGPPCHGLARGFSANHTKTGTKAPQIQRNRRRRRPAGFFFGAQPSPTASSLVPIWRAQRKIPWGSSDCQSLNRAPPPRLDSVPRSLPLAKKRRPSNLTHTHQPYNRHTLFDIHSHQHPSTHSV